MTVTRKDRANAVRMLSVDAVQKANSGHPGMPMGMADIAEVLWHDFLRHNPKNPHWADRDRFVLSNGHGCMLLYALLHLTGYDLTIEDIKQFRQLHSKTPGHPEWGETPGVETTTGPLGQGLANAVGMAIAERHLAAEFNQPDFPIINHHTYAFVGDGCLMEGISHEACSLAGTLGLSKLVVFYDDNNISIDGEVQGWYTDNTPMRFAAYGWHVIPAINGHDSEAIRQAILKAHDVTDRPTLVCCKTIIGWGAPNLAGTAATHGAALGDKEIAEVRKYLQWPHAPFHIPDTIYDAWHAGERGSEQEAAWSILFAAYQKAYPLLASEFLRRMDDRLPALWQEKVDDLIHACYTKKESIASRKASQQCLNHFAPFLPELMGGSADLTESNCADWKGMEIFSKMTPIGRFIHYGVREFGMSAIMNGMALHQGLIPYGATFLTFSDYARNALRLASLMRQKVIFVYTHDSIGLGEDGPTHQPIEHLPSLRLMPHLSVWRPCDTVESAVAWSFALAHRGPTCLLFSRQNLPYQERTTDMLADIKRGGYILLDDSKGKPDVILISTGSEVALAMTAAEQLRADSVRVRVVSMPSMDVFLQQDTAYQETVLPKTIKKRVAIEAAASDAWYKFVGLTGKVVGIDRFGASAPAKDVFRDCGVTIERILSVVKEMMRLHATKNTCNSESN